MTKISIPALLILLVAFTGLTRAALQPASAATRDRITAYLNTYATQHHIPCLLVGYQLYQTSDANHTHVTAQERWSHANEGGLADIENGVACRATDTMLKVSSVTKPITVALVASLVEAGKLHWDDDVHKYLPESVFPKKSFNGSPVTITLAELASQHHGIRQSVDHDYLHDMDRYHNTTETLALFSHDALLAKPGTKETYSNFALSVLGAVVEAVEHRNYYLVLDEFLRQRAHMTHGQSYNRATMFAHLGQQYQVVTDPATKQVRTEHAPGMDYQRPYPHWPCCSVVATVDDVVNFGDLMLRSYRGWSGAGQLKPETVHTVWNHRANAGGDGTGSVTVDGHAHGHLPHRYVLGWNRLDFPSTESDPVLAGLEVVSHGGEMNSAHAIVAVMPGVNFVFAAVANRGGAGDLQSLAVQIYHMLASGK